jgi:Protein of unknown function DUF262/HNH endonuclease
MKTNTKNFAANSVYGLRERINTNPDYQRPAVWAKAQKQLLLDTILRGYDIPKLYWKKVSDKPEKYDVVDGQQRIRALWDFFNNEFSLSGNSDDIDGEKVSGFYYRDLPTDLRISLDSYQLHIVIIEDADEDEVREMFLRLQNGTSLKAQEKRNAMTGQMRDAIKKLATMPFWMKAKFGPERFNYDQVAAQLMAIELAAGPTNVKNTELNKMYEKNKEFDISGLVMKSITRKLNEMDSIFSEKSPELEKQTVIAVYLIITTLIEKYNFASVKGNLQNWLINFEQRRLIEESKSPDSDEQDIEWINYIEKTKHATDSRDNITYRVDFMFKDLLIHVQGITLKDESRIFSHDQKMAIFRRDGGHCQLKIKCGGDKLPWDNWHCDHRIPHSKGGKTVVENGLASCVSCNTSKGNNG